MKNLITKYYKHIILIVFLFLLDILTKIFFKGKNIEITNSNVDFSNESKVSLEAGKVHHVLPP